MQFDLIQLFHAIQRTSAALREALVADDRDYPVWLATQAVSVQSAEQMRQQIAAHCTQYWYQHSGDGRKAERLAGAVAASENTLTLVNTLNQYKQQFQQQLASLRQHDRGYDNVRLQHLLQAAYTRHQTVQQQLSEAHLQRLNLTQLYRQLPVLTQTPRLLGFSWAKGKRSKVRLTPEQAITLVRERFGDDRPAFIEQLCQLPAGAVLAQIRPVQPALIINCAVGEGSATKRCQRQGHSPLFYPWSDCSTMATPKIKWPGALPAQQPSQTRKEKGPEQLILPALDLYLLTN